jgi:hypothetical protein
MDEGVGRTLRETRTRRKIDLADVEAATKIRSRFLRAIENEEWDQLPGEIYGRAFIRAYASHLGLDGERLAEEQRRDRGAARPGEGLPRADPVPARQPRRRSPRRVPSVSPRLLAAVVSAVLVAILIVVGLSSGGDSPQPTGAAKHGRSAHGKAEGNAADAEAPRAQPGGHVVELTANAEVWVCLLDAGGEPLIDGQILSAGSSEGPYRSGSFTVSFGNGEVTMMVDGQQASIPQTSSPVGYSIGGGALRPLSEGERPTCT